MALRSIVTEGDELLRKKSRQVTEINERICTLLDDLADTMYYENRGIGLAAVQVGVLRRVFVVDVGDEHGLIEFINPEIIETSGNQVYCEGCLSVPGRNANVNRPAKIKIRATIDMEKSLSLKLKEFLPFVFVMNLITSKAYCLLIRP